MSDLGNQVSVCLLTYNHAHLLESTLASIQQQTLTGYEIIVSDDCSTDGTWSLLQRLAAVDPRIRPLRTPTNLGMPGNANFAVAQCNETPRELRRLFRLRKPLKIRISQPRSG